MDWEKKYRELTSGFYKCCDDISVQYPDCNDFEKCVIALRSKGGTYGDIQKKLGMPPKKEISRTLNNGAPELIDNSRKKITRVNPGEAELYNIIKIKPSQKLSIEIEDENYIFYIVDNKLLFEDGSSSDNVFSELDTRTQQQFLITIKEKENE